MPLERFNRSNFLETVVIDGIKEVDMVSNSINDFEFRREKRFYRVVAEDVQRPDLIAMKAYKSAEAMQYWHVIMALNNIHDIWNDIRINDILIIPDKKDLEDFFVFNRNR